MNEQTPSVTDLTNSESTKPLGPREFVLRYLRYLPWIIICVALSMVFAFINLRYATLVYHVQSSMLIKNERADMGGVTN